MKILCWNCQGLGTPLTVQHIRALVAQERPNLVFLMETKNKENKVNRVRKSLNFDHSTIINPVGTAGGLILMWDDQVNVDAMTCLGEIIDVKCKVLNSGDQMRVTFLHASTSFQERLSLWQTLSSINSSNNLPWLCMGDFNEVLYYRGKVGRRETDRHRMVAFRNFIDSCSLMDMESKGCKFTWSNNREGNDLVKKRLDRALCNWAWRVQFPNVEVFALPAIGSDHSPCYLPWSQTI